MVRKAASFSLSGRGSRLGIGLWDQQDQQAMARATVPDDTEKQGFQPCHNRAVLLAIQATWFNFERRADSPNC